MKKTISILTAALLLLSLCACGNSAPAATQPPVPETPVPSEDPAESPAAESMGQALLKDFADRVNADPEIGAEALAKALMENPVIQFSGDALPVEPGLLTGFGNTEITGFAQGAMFAPMIGTIPFVGYIFVLEDDADIDGFTGLLKDNADLRWNICTEAEELVVHSVNNTVFFLMCPKSFEA